MEEKNTIGETIMDKEKKEERMARIMDENIEVFRDWARHILCAMRAELRFLSLLGENGDKDESSLKHLRESMDILNADLDKALKNVELIQNADTLFYALGEETPLRKEMDTYMSMVASLLASDDALKVDAELTEKKMRAESDGWHEC